MPCDVAPTFPCYFAGDAYFTLDRPMMALAETMAQRLPDSIMCQWPLARVDHGPDGALLYGPSGRRIRCRHLILALPHAIMKSESILFSPSLPAHKNCRSRTCQGVECHQGGNPIPKHSPDLLQLVLYYRSADAHAQCQAASENGM